MTKVISRYDKGWVQVTAMPRHGINNTPRDIRERFMEKVSPEPNSGCWLWTGAIVTGGYGVIARGDGTRTNVQAHRLAFELFKGQKGEGFICHHCDNRSCVNPDHLFVGDHAANMRDMWEKGRSGLRNAVHPRRLTDDQVRDIRSRRMSLSRFAKLYSIDLALVSRIASKKVYCDVRD